jgi:uncharacterized protein YdeI (YjbR/CyaY-like superfamily)
MEKQEKLDQFYNEAHHFKSGVASLRKLALDCGLTETYKWSFPTYMIDDKNVIAISKFKTHFGVWFFKGVFLIDPKKVLKNAQEGKTKAMRHWQFSALEEVDKIGVTAYINEAVENQIKGMQLKVSKKPKVKIEIPSLLSKEFSKNPEIKDAFNKLTYSKQKEYTEYITTAKQEKTKLSRLVKIVPLVLEGKGLNDIYRK